MFCNSKIKITYTSLSIWLILTDKDWICCNNKYQKSFRLFLFRPAKTTYLYYTTKIRTSTFCKKDYSESKYLIWKGNKLLLNTFIDISMCIYIMYLKKKLGLFSFWCLKRLCLVAKIPFNSLHPIRTHSRTHADTF